MSYFSGVESTKAGLGPAGNEDNHNAVDFRDIVDRNESYYKQQASQLFAGYLVESLPFRIGILVAITLNSIVVGLQTNKYLVSEIMHPANHCNLAIILITGSQLWAYFAGVGQILPDYICSGDSD